MMLFCHLNKMLFSDGKIYWLNRSETVRIFVTNDDGLCIYIETTVCPIEHILVVKNFTFLHNFLDTFRPRWYQFYLL